MVVSLGTLGDGNVASFRNFLGNGRVKKSSILGVCGILAKARLLLLDLNTASLTHL